MWNTRTRTHIKIVIITQITVVISYYASEAKLSEGRGGVPLSLGGEGESIAVPPFAFVRYFKPWRNVIFTSTTRRKYDQA